MLIFSKINKSKEVLWVWTLLLSMVLLFGQNLSFHVHSLDHDDNQQFSHMSVALVDDHSNLGDTHLSSDTSHSDHHAEIVSEIDTSLTALPENISAKILTLAFLFTLLLFFLPGFYQLIVHRHLNPRVKKFWRYHFSPPLRAPPL